MTLSRAIQIASTWSQGHVCSLRPGEAEEYHKMALEALIRCAEGRDIRWKEGMNIVDKMIKQMEGNEK